MKNKVEKLDWDSSFFGLNVGRFRYKNSPDLLGLKQSAFDLIYIFSDHEIDNDVIGQLELLPVDKKITYSFSLISDSPLIFPAGIKPYTSGNDDSIITLGIQSSIYSRFKKDVNFKAGTFEDLFSTWIKRSISREIADEVYVSYSESNEPMGVVTLKKNTDHISISIIAVDEKHRGKNVGSSLIEAAKWYCQENKCLDLRVVTQAENIPACRFYSHCGFKIHSTEYVYHYWKKLQLVK